MSELEKNNAELESEIAAFRIRLEEALEALSAIGNGAADVLVVSGPEKEQIFSLEGAEKPYRLLVETMNEGAVTMTIDGYILYCNNCLATLLKVPLERMIGTWIGMYVVPSDLLRIKALLEKCSQEKSTAEVTMVTAAGTLVPVMISCCTLNAMGGVEICAVLTDLTQQKLNEEILASEKLARSIIEQAGEAIVVCDKAGIVIQANECAHALCGKNPLFKLFDELFTFISDNTEGGFSVRTPLTGRSLGCFDVAFKRTDQRLFHLLLTATPLTNSQRSIIGCVVTLADITDRKHRNTYKNVGLKIKQILNKSGNLQESTFQAISSLKDLTACTAIGVRLKNENGFSFFVQLGFSEEFLAIENKLDMCNVGNGVCQIKNCDGQKECICGLILSGKTPENFPDFTPGGSFFTNDLSAVMDYLPLCLPGTVLRTTCIDHGFVSVACVPIKCKDRVIGLIQLNDLKYRQFNSDIISMMEDIASHIGEAFMHKQIEEEKAKLLAEFQQAQKMELVGRLAGGVAHDFNNMLCVILGYSELVLNQMDCTHTLFKPLTEIKRAATQSQHVTHQLLAFARKQIIAPHVLDLGVTVSETLNMLQRLIGEDIELQWCPAQNLWPVKTDPSQINQILTNLCLNARDSICGAGKIFIEIANCTIRQDFCIEHPDATPGECVRLMVRDNGCGMQPEIMAHIFEPFFTTKSVGAGTGLGLSTVYGAVKQNSGFIDVQSEPGVGTSFMIYLPRHTDPTAHQTFSTLPDKLPSGKETVLLVEDEECVRELTVEFLAGQGYTVLAANTPNEAIRLAMQHQGGIQLLVTDVVMPGMNGRDLARVLLNEHPQLRHMFMSGYTADIIAQHGILDADIYFIQKPFTRTALLAKVREVIDAPVVSKFLD